MFDLLFILLGFNCFAYVELAPALPTYLVESKPVKHEVSRTVIPPTMVSVL